MRKVSKIIVIVLVLVFLCQQVSWAETIRGYRGKRVDLLGFVESPWDTVTSLAMAYAGAKFSHMKGSFSSIMAKQWAINEFSRGLTSLAVQRWGFNPNSATVFGSALSAGLSNSLGQTGKLNFDLFAQGFGHGAMQSLSGMGMSKLLEHTKMPQGIKADVSNVMGVYIGTGLWTGDFNSAYLKNALVPVVSQYAMWEVLDKGRDSPRMLSTTLGQAAGALYNKGNVGQAVLRGVVSYELNKQFDPLKSKRGWSDLQVSLGKFAAVELVTGIARGTGAMEYLGKDMLKNVATLGDSAPWTKDWVNTPINRGVFFNKQAQMFGYNDLVEKAHLYGSGWQDNMDKILPNFGSAMTRYAASTLDYSAADALVKLTKPLSYRRIGGDICEIQKIKPNLWRATPIGGKPFYMIHQIEPRLGGSASSLRPQVMEADAKMPAVKPLGAENALSLPPAEFKILPQPPTSIGNIARDSPGELLKPQLNEAQNYSDRGLSNFSTSTVSGWSTKDWLSNKDVLDGLWQEIKPFVELTNKYHGLIENGAEAGMLQEARKEFESVKSSFSENPQLADYMAVVFIDKMSYHQQPDTAQSVLRALAYIAAPNEQSFREFDNTYLGNESYLGDPSHPTETERLLGPEAHTLDDRLMKAALAPDLNVGVTSVKILGFMAQGGSENSYYVLKDIINGEYAGDVPQEVRKEAMITLSRNFGQRAVEPLISCLEDMNYEVSATAAVCLGEIRDPAAIGPLSEILEDKSYFDRVKNENTQEEKFSIYKMAAWEEHKLGSYKVVEAAAKALGEIGDQKAIVGLHKALRHSAYDVRYAAVNAMAKINAPIAVDLLVNDLNDNVWYVRQSAAYGLGEIGGLKERSALENFVRKESTGSIKKVAVEAISKINNRQNSIFK